MTQDFAKIRPEPILERRTVETPSAWSLMATGVIVGITIGVFGCLMFYLSGNVPPLNNSPMTADNAVAPGITAKPIDAAGAPAEETLEFEFYTALSDYEVEVDATPVQIDEPALAADQPLDKGYILQTGAFRQLESATSEMQLQRALGLAVVVKREDLQGRILYLVRSGPYTSSSQLKAAEQLLRTHNIPSLRMRLR